MVLGKSWIIPTFARTRLMMCECAKWNLFVINITSLVRSHSCDSPESTKRFSRKMRMQSGDKSAFNSSTFKCFPTEPEHDAKRIKQWKLLVNFLNNDTLREMSEIISAWHGQKRFSPRSTRADVRVSNWKAIFKSSIQLIIVNQHRITLAIIR